MQTTTLALRGMRCAACASGVESALQSAAGVRSVEVNFAAEQAIVSFDPKRTSLPALQAAVAEAGYEAEPLVSDLLAEEAADRSRLALEKQLQTQVIVGAIISAVLMLGMLPMITGRHWQSIALLHNFWLQAILTAPVQFWCGRQFYINAWKSLKRHTATMDTLIVLGTSAAYLYSLAVTIDPRWLIQQGLQLEVYYETASVVITLILVGRWFEQRARRQTSAAIRKLIGLQAKDAQVIRNGQEVAVPIASVRVGDIVVVRP
ncbi:MAG: cation-translocating P-type ATPase, partial [Microcoleus sp. SIO2G3]|nr:cation-translocating P-type ATPase [Microcoleus sp. SIO2G3]